MINVKDSPYNAAGDGTTDDTQAIQDAIDDAKDAADSVYVSGGVGNIGSFLAFIGSASVVLSGGALSVGSVDLGCSPAPFTRMLQSGGSLLVSNELNFGTGTFYRYNDGSLTATTLNVVGGEFIMGPGPNKVARMQALSITENGKMNIADAAAIVNYSGASPITSIRDMIQTGYNNGSWDGVGINSSMAAASPGHGIGFAEASAIFGSFPAMFRGQEVDDTTVVVGYTRYGDADLNGFVNLDDFNRLAANFGANFAVWSQGDFNYSGHVTLEDFNLLANNFGLADLRMDPRRRTGPTSRQRSPSRSVDAFSRHSCRFGAGAEACHRDLYAGQILHLDS